MRSGVEVRHRQPEDVSQDVVVQLASALQRRQVEKQRRDNHCHGLQNNEIVNCFDSLTFKICERKSRVQVYKTF